VLVGRLRLKPTIAFEKAGPLPALGDLGCFVRADNGWAEALCSMDRFVKNTHEILGPLASVTAHARLTKLEFLTPDRAVRRATFGGSGGRPAATVTVNFGPGEFVVESSQDGKVKLPTWGFLIESPRFIAFHATSWAGRDYNAPVLFTVRMDGKHTHIFHGFGDARLTWRGRDLEVRRELQIK